MDTNPVTEATEPSVFDFDQVDFVTSDHHWRVARSGSGVLVMR